MSDNITLQGERAYTALPVLEIVGWSGSSDGWEMYSHWQQDKNLPMALMIYAGTRSKEKRELIKNEIITIFYGGHDNFEKFKKIMIDSMPDVTTKQEEA